MSAYWPPLENLPTFDVLVFRNAQDVVDYAVATGTANNIAGGVAGDLLYQSAPNNTAKLPIGANTYILTSDGSTPQWSPPSVASTPTLANVLLTGNSAGATNIDMNSQSITNANNITATTFNGTLNGTANIALRANTIDTTTLPGASAFYYLNYVDTSTGSTSRTVYTNSSFYFNPASGILAGAVINLFGGLGNVSSTASSRLINNTFYNLMDNTAVAGGTNRGNLTTTSTVASLNLTSATHRFTITNNSGAITTFAIDPADLTITTTNNPTITGFTDPATTDSTAKIPTTRWVQSALTSGVATATTIQVTDTNVATVYYPIFCTGASGQKSLLLDSATGPLSYQPSTGTLSALVLTVGTSPNNSFFNQSTTVTQYVNNATSSQHRFYVNDATPTQINPFTITSSACTSSVPFSVSYTGGAVTTYVNVPSSGFLNGIADLGDNMIVTTSGAISTETLTLTTWSNTSSGVRINPSSLIIGSGGITRPPANNITFDGVGNNITVTALNCPTQTGYTVPASTDSTSKIATTQWVQSALTSGVATATTIQVTDNDTSTTMYPVFTTATAGQKSLLFDSTTTPLRYKPDTSELSAQRFTVNGLNTVAGDNAGYLAQNIGASATTIQNQATSGRIHLAVRDASNVLSNALIVTSTDSSAAKFSVGSISNPVAGDNAGYIAQNIGASATTIQNQATSGSIRLITRDAISNAINTFEISTTDLTVTTTNNPTITGFTAPATTDNTAKIATTSWVQSALTSGVATATTVEVADNNTSTTMYPIFTTATAGQKSLLFDSTTTPLRYKPSTGVMSAVQFAVGGFVEPVAGDNAGLISQNIGVSATTVQNQATSGSIRLVTRDAISNAINTFQISTTDCTVTTTNNPTITGFTAPATTDNTAKIATTSWVQSALTSGVATATTVEVADNDSATTMYPVFTTTGAGQKSLLFDSTTTPLRYKPSTGIMSSLQFAVGTFVEPIAGDNGGLIQHNTGLSVTIIQNQATSGLIRLQTRDATNALAIPFQISFSDCNITTTNDPVIYSRNILVDNGSTLPITIGNGSSTSTSNIIMTSNSLASTRVFTLGGNVIIGPVAGNSLPVGATNNTVIGTSAGGTTSGSRNICIGYNSQVPTVANSNQIAIGTVAETLYVQGGFNWRVGTQITNSTNGNLSAVVLAQFYTVAMTAASQTILLPTPTTAAYRGATVTFKRKTNTTVFTITAGAGTPFLPINSITAALSISVAATVFQVTLVCDGVNWCSISQA